MRVSSPIVQPYRLTKQNTCTFFPIRTSGAMRRKLMRSVALSMGMSIGEGTVRQDHSAALGPDAARGRFQVTHDAQPQLPAANRHVVVADTLGEVRDGCLQ